MIVTGDQSLYAGVTVAEITDAVRALNAGETRPVKMVLPELRDRPDNVVITKPLLDVERLLQLEDTVMNFADAEAYLLGLDKAYVSTPDDAGLGAFDEMMDILLGPGGDDLHMSPTVYIMWYIR